MSGPLAHARAAALLCALSTAASPGGELVVGEAELLYTDEQLSTVPGIHPGGVVIDAAFATLRGQDGTMQFLLSGWRGLDRYVGPLDKPFARHLSSSPQEATWLSGLRGAEGWRTVGWVPGVCRLESGALLGIVHVERSKARDQDHFYDDATYSIGLAYSVSDGLTWEYCGDIVRPKHPGGRLPGFLPFMRRSVMHNVGGGPFLVVGEYAYVYFNEYYRPNMRRMCVARAPLMDVVASVASGRRVTPWRKYYEGSWDEDGLTGVGSNILPDMDEPNAWPFDLNTDAAYCAPLGRFLLLAQTHHRGELIMYQSDDGVVWEDPITVDRHGSGVEKDAGAVMQAYATFVSAAPGSTDDCMVIGSPFYVVFPRKSMTDYNREALYRRKVTVR